MDDLPAYLAHIVSQTRQNIIFLASQHQISPTDGDDILAKLPALDDAPSLPDLSADLHAAAITPLNIARKASASATAAMPAAAPHLLAGVPAVYAQAKWDYTSQDSPADLAFRAGDVIEVITEPHRDWWHGRNLKCGLFPAVYVEKMAASVTVASPVPSLSQLPAALSPEPAAPAAAQYTPPYFPRQSDAPAPAHTEHVRSGSGGTNHPVANPLGPRNLPKAPNPWLSLGR